MKAKKLFAALMCCIMACVMFACDDTGIGSGIEEKIDYTRTQLYVSNFNGGYGDKWLRDIKTRFEEKYKDVDTIEDGKKGVQVLIDNAKTSGTGLINTMRGSSSQVFFSEGISYREFVAQGLFLDITDMVNEKLTEYGEDRSVFDKFNDVQQQYLSVDGKVYAVPHYEGYNGITIDVDLFDSKSLFLGRDGTFLYKSTDKEKLSFGPDNKQYTYDDGLPATYKEFYALCGEISKRGVTPISWSGEFQFYVKNLVTAMAADDNGYDETVRGFSFSGEATNLVKMDTLSDGTYETENVDISNSNGYDILRQEGYYNALKFLQTIISNKWYSDTSFTDAVSQTDAQDRFLMSNKDSSLKSIAMLVEGCWWENEASDTFSMLSTRYPNSAKTDRRFRFIPFPKSSADKVGQGQTMLEDVLSYGFINANIDEKFKDLALDFLQFCNTDRALVDFTVTTNTPKGLLYEMEDSDLDKCTYFGRSVFERKSAQDSKVVYPLSANALYNDNYSTLAMTNRIAYGTYLYPSTAFKDYSISAETYFKELYASMSGKWNTTYAKYI